MSIAVTCVQCQKQYSVGEELVGRSVRCKNCGATFVGEKKREKAAMWEGEKVTATKFW